MKNRLITKFSNYQITKLKMVVCGLWSILFSPSLFSQDVQIPNSGFETWITNNFFENPTGFYTSNNDLINSNDLTVIKSNDKYQGNYAARIETKGTNDFPIFGTLYFGKPSEGLTEIPYDGGFPYSQKPDSISGYFKFNLAANDSATLFVIFMKNGQPILHDKNYDVFKIYGIQSTFKKLRFKIQDLNVIPDSAIVGLISGDPNGSEPNIGNWIIVDNIGFTKGTTTTLIPNGGFENWQTISREEPALWNDLNAYIPPFQNGYVTKTSPSHSGNFALKIMTQELIINDQSVYASYATTGKILISKKKSISDIADGGFPINSNPDSVGFWYKYNNENNTNDKGLFILKFSKFYLNNTWEMGKIQLSLEPTTSYVYKKIKLNIGNPNLPGNMQIADTANIILSSSDYFYPDNIGIGNELIIDDLKFIYKSTPGTGHMISGTVTYDNNASTPLTNNIKVYLKNSLNKKIDSVFTDANGKYAFNNVAPGTYTLDGTSAKKYFNSGPTQGLMAMKYFIGTYVIKNNLRKKAGDVDNNTKINSTDALYMNKRFVGMITNYKIPFWVFENPSVTVADSDVVVDFKGICAGDIGGAYSPPAN